MSSLFVLPVAFVVEGKFGPTLFINRYLMPVAIGTAFLTAEMLQLIDWRGFVPAKLRVRISEAEVRWAGAAALSVVLLYWVFVHLPPLMLAPFDYTDELTAALPKDAPVLVEDSFVFAESIGRKHDSGVRYIFPLDWEETISAHAPRAEVTEYNLLKNWRKVGYFSGSIVDLKEFLAENGKFYVVDSQFYGDVPYVPTLGNPLVLRFAHTPGYHVQQVGGMVGRGPVRTIWRVTRDATAAEMPVQCRFGEADAVVTKEPTCDTVASR